MEWGGIGLDWCGRLGWGGLGWGWVGEREGWEGAAGRERNARSARAGKGGAERTQWWVMVRGA